MSFTQNTVIHTVSRNSKEQEMFGLFKKRKIEGFIGLHGLEQWWLKELSESERKEILSTFQPMGGDSSSLISGKISTNQKCSDFLATLAGWFKAGNIRQHKGNIRDVHKIIKLTIPVFFIL